MKKLILFFVLTLMPLLINAYDAYIDGIYYNLISKGSVAEVTWKPAGKYTGNIDIPESVTYKGVTYSVTTIGNSAFDACNDLTSVTIPNSVKAIGDIAFTGCI